MEGQKPESQKEEEAPGSWLLGAGLARFASGEVGVFKLDDVNRDSKSIMGGSVMMKCSDTGDSVSVESLLDVPGLVLHSIEILEEKFFLLFMQVPSVAKVMELPFLDRGVRAVTEIGSKVYVARLDKVEELAGLVPINKLPPSDQSHFSIVWNTGRCGSTLMHRMLRKVGVLSFTEPYWLDKICGMKEEGIDNETVGRLFGVCGAMDVMLARKSLASQPPVSGAASTVGATHVSFNPKGKGFMAMEAIVKSAPHARHMLMYRDPRKIAESFGSIFQRNSFGGLAEGEQKKPQGERAGGPPPPRKLKPGQAPPVFSKTVAEAMASDAIALPSNGIAKMCTMGWLESLCLWDELTEAGASAEGAMASIKMEDYTRKEPEVIERILHFFLCNDGVEINEDVVTTALEAFNRHSQEGDPMSASSHAAGSGTPPFLTPSDEEEIVAAVAGVPKIGTPEFTTPNSLGARPAAAQST